MPHHGEAQRKEINYKSDLILPNQPHHDVSKFLIDFPIGRGYKFIAFLFFTPILSHLYTESNCYSLFDRK